MNLLLDKDSDLAFINNGFQTVSGLDEMAQKVDNCLNSFKGDWFLNLTLGVPYFQTILQKGTTDDQIEAILTDYIASIEGVITILSFEIETNTSTREAGIKVRIKTKDGVLDFSKNF